MKKVFSLLLTLTMAITLVACSANTGSNPPSVDLKILKKADDQMLNTYSVIAVNPDAPFVDADGNRVNPDATLAVTAIDDRTLEVTINNVITYWNELLAFPAYFPVRQDVVEKEAWATKPGTYICNGPYTMTEWKHNSVITLSKNSNYHDPEQVTMKKLRFFLSDDANNMLTNFQNGTWQLIEDVPTNEIKSLKKKYPQEFVISGQIGTYYLCWNANQSLQPK